MKTITIPGLLREIRVAEFDGESLWMARDVCQAIGIEKNNANHYTSRDYLKGKFKFVCSEKQYPHRMFTLEGMKEVARRARNTYGKRLAEHLGIEVDGRYCPTESELVEIIQAAFPDYEQVLQFVPKGLRYKLDLYFPQFRVAVECDERGHVTRKKTKEQIRQKEIEDLLGCVFVRFNPDAENFNVGKTIYEIRHRIGEQTEALGI